MGSSLGQSYPAGYAEMLAQQTIQQTNEQATMLYPVGDPDAAAHEQCRKDVTTQFDAYLREVHAWIDSQFAGTSTARPSVPRVIRTAIEGAKGAVVEGLSGLQGGLAGAFVGIVVSMSANAIISPVLNPVKTALAHGLADVVITSNKWTTIEVICEHNSSPVVNTP